MSKTVTIPLGNGVYKNVDALELTDFDAELRNCYVDEMGFTRKRPGLLLFKDLTSTLGTSSYPVTGIYWWVNKNYAIVVGYNKVLKLTYSLGYATITDITTATINMNGCPIFTTDGTYVFVANGGKIVYTDGTTATAYISDADCPTAVTHVDWLDGYLLAAGDGTNKFYWSDVNSSLSWNALNYASAAGNPDPIIALKVFERQIYLFGEQTLEIWENDGVTPFIRSAAGFYNVGCGAKYSVITTDQAMYWVSDSNRIMKLQNGNISMASTPYDKMLTSFTSISDCIATKITIEGKIFLVFTFVTEDKTLVFSESDNKWHEWTFFDGTSSKEYRWLGQCSCWASKWGFHLVGDRNTGLIFKFSPTHYNDNGGSIRMTKATGFLNYGTEKLKRSEDIRLRVKRGFVDIGRDPRLMLRWNDNGDKWSKEHYFSLGELGDYFNQISIKRSGMFYNRQYEIVITDDIPVVLGNGEEDITVLR